MADFYNCLFSLPRSFDVSTETIIGFVQRCGKPVIDNTGPEMARILGVVGALRLPNELIDFTRRGDSAWAITVSDANAPPTLDVHAAALRAAGGPSNVIADVDCPDPIQRPSGAVVLYKVITQVGHGGEFLECSETRSG